MVLRRDAAWPVRADATLRSLETLSLDVAWGKLRVTSEALVMAISFHSDVTRHPAEASGEAATSHESGTPNAAHTAYDDDAHPVRDRNPNAAHAHAQRDGASTSEARDASARTDGDAGAPHHLASLRGRADGRDALAVGAVSVLVGAIGACGAFALGARSARRRVRW